MLVDTGSVRNYFAKLGLDPHVVDIYLALQAYGPQSLLQLSRNAGVERTRLYRLIDTLTDYRLIEIETHYKRKVFKAAPITNLQIVLSKREQELRDLHDELGELHARMEKTSRQSPLTHVQFYRGTDGIKQMLWNETKCNTENLAILYENMQHKTKLAFFQRWVEKFNTRDIHCRGIISDHFIQTQQQWYGTHSNERLHHWESRYLPDAIFLITHSMVTYDDVVAYYNWKDGEIFGIEVYNQEIANAQRQFFEMLWQQGQPVDDLVGPTRE